MAYAVGLLATDGCLLDRPRQIAFVTMDLQLVETLFKCLGREQRFRSELTPRGRILYRAQFKDITLYRWLEAAGLTPRKSLTLGALSVPDVLLADTVRGLLDGDGSIINRVWRADMTRRPDSQYFYEFLRVHFVSASRAHLDWLRARLTVRLGLRGGISATVRPGRNPLYRLMYAKHDSIALMRWIYADRSAPCLVRKRDIWDSYRSRHGLE
jgi:hypothetical protein